MLDDGPAQSITVSRDKTMATPLAMPGSCTGSGRHAFRRYLALWCLEVPPDLSLHLRQVLSETCYKYYLHPLFTENRQHIAAPLNEHNLQAPSNPWWHFRQVLLLGCWRYATNVIPICWPPANLWHPAAYTRALHSTQSVRDQGTLMPPSVEQCYSY